MERLDALGFETLDTANKAREVTHADGVFHHFELNLRDATDIASMEVAIRAALEVLQAGYTSTTHIAMEVVKTDSDGDIESAQWRFFVYTPSVENAGEVLQSNIQRWVISKANVYEDVTAFAIMVKV